MRRSFLLYPLIATAFCLIVCVGSSTAQTQKSGLSQTQIQQLIHANNPDNVIANAVSSKGISFKVTPKTLDDLKAAGAGPQTLDQLRAKIEAATIVLAEGTSAATVSIDGAIKSQFSPGFPTSVQVSTGKHHISVSLQDWRPLDLDVNLSNKETYTLHGMLTWGGGHINVQASPVSAFLSIHPLDPKNSRFEIKTQQRNMALGSDVLEGDYLVSATLPGYTTTSQQITVHSGENVPVNLALQKDPTYFKRKVEDMNSRLDERSAASILQEANRLTADDHLDADLIDLRLRASWLADNMQEFQALALNVMHDGFSVPVSLQHIHIGLKDSKHPARLTLTSKGISYDPLGNACSQAAFTEGWDTLQTIQFAKTAAGMPILSLHVKLASKGGKTVTLSFTSGDLPFNASGPQNDISANKLQAVQEILTRQKERVSGTN